MFTRRTATVTTSAPDTSMAFFVSTKSLYLPVPTHSRDLNSRPAITNRSLCMVKPFPLSGDFCRCSAPDEAQDLHTVPFLETPKLKLLAVKNFQIQLHCDSFRPDVKLA